LRQLIKEGVPFKFICDNYSDFGWEYGIEKVRWQYKKLKAEMTQGN